ncbi:MAG: hypothetical protein AABY22_06740 [Nanoarchaeota archaeon]
MKRIILVTLLMLLIYVIFINLISHITSMDLTQEIIKNTKNQEGSQQEIGMGMSVDITVQKNRFYGKIIETSKNSKLYALSFILIPLISKGVNFKFIHLIFFIFLTIVFIFLTILYYSNRERRRKYVLDTQNFADNNLRTNYDNI